MPPPVEKNEIFMKIARSMGPWTRENFFARDERSDKMEIREQIEQDLLDQLERNGTVGEYYKDLVRDYMSLWSTKNMLAQDIEERGAVVDYESNTGTINKRKNESVSELVKVNGQMIKLLDAMGISPAQAGGMDEDM